MEFGADDSPTAFFKPLLDSSDIVQHKDWASLRERLNHDGYLFVRAALPSADVDAARMRVLEHLEELSSGVAGDSETGANTAAHQVILDPSQPLQAGVLMQNCGFGCVPFMEGRNAVTHSPELLKVFEGEALRGIFQGIFGTEAVRSFDFKWLRAVPREKFTGAHVDSVYMSRGTDKLLTTWIPFGINPLERGGLCICEGSHRLPGFERLRETYVATVWRCAMMARRCHYYHLHHHYYHRHQTNNIPHTPVNQPTNQPSTRTHTHTKHARARTHAHTLSTISTHTHTKHTHTLSTHTH